MLDLGTDGNYRIKFVIPSHIRYHKASQDITRHHKTSKTSQDITRHHKKSALMTQRNSGEQGNGDKTSRRVYLLRPTVLEEQLR
ncbi:hypothetical protein ACROYT_G034189 [Oculina patagonica]